MREQGRRQHRTKSICTCENSVLNLHQGIASSHLDAQVDHQEHGDRHYDALDQQWKLIVGVEPREEVHFDEIANWSKANHLRWPLKARPEIGSKIN